MNLIDCVSLTTSRKISAFGTDFDTISRYIDREMVLSYRIMISRLCRLIFFVFLLCYFIINLSFPANAGFLQAGENVFAPTIFPSEKIISEEKPVVLKADNIDYDQKNNLVIATGKVEAVQGETILLCDKLTYDKAKDVVLARGNVVVVDETGSAIFAEEAELRDSFRAGVIEQFKARLSDDSVFAANRAVRINEYVMELEQAVYSPCKVKCVDDLPAGTKPRNPLWQVRANKVIIDDQKQDVTYRNAFMELYGFPVFYTPYLSHATPKAPSRAGIMTPEFLRDRNLGNIYKLPLYYPIAPDRDIVVTPIYTSQEGLVMRSLYRQKYDSGNLRVDASATNPRDRDAAGNIVNGRRWRGHLYTRADFNPENNTYWGFDAKRTTDDTYMRKYKIDGETLLTSKIYGEKYGFINNAKRSAISAEAVTFQGLTADDNSNLMPLVLPLINADYETDPGVYGSRYFVNGSAQILTRDLGAESRRISSTVGWRVPYITESGQRVELRSQMRGDIYNNSDVLLSNGNYFSGTTGRLVPEISLDWRYPLIKSFANSANKANIENIVDIENNDNAEKEIITAGSLTLEPVVRMILSPNGGNPEKISNEDSLVPEFSDGNLFANNRFSGYDRIEQGPRLSYGMRGLANYRKFYFDGLLGQHYRVQEDRSFPFSNDLNDHFSDYVGKAGIQWRDFYLAYRFRFDKEELSSLRNEIDMSYSGKRLQLATSYLSLQNDPILSSREEISATTNLVISNNWLVGANFRKDIEIDQITNVGGQLLYKNECIGISYIVSREFTRDREIKPSTKYLVTVSLKNLN